MIFGLYVPIFTKNPSYTLYNLLLNMKKYNPVESFNLVKIYNYKTIDIVNNKNNNTILAYENEYTINSNDVEQNLYNGLILK